MWAVGTVGGAHCGRGRKGGVQLDGVEERGPGKDAGRTGIFLVRARMQAAFGRRLHPCESDN